MYNIYVHIRIISGKLGHIINGKRGDLEYTLSSQLIVYTKHTYGPNVC